MRHGRIHSYDIVCGVNATPIQEVGGAINSQYANTVAIKPKQGTCSIGGGDDQLFPIESGLSFGDLTSTGIELGFDLSKMFIKGLAAGDSVTVLISYVSTRSD